jgi:hypothetical protein
MGLFGVQRAPGFEASPEQQTQGNAMLDALKAYYVDTYGPLIHGDTSGLKKALATDPFSVGQDLAVARRCGEGCGGTRSCGFARGLCSYAIASGGRFRQGRGDSRQVRHN